VERKVELQSESIETAGYKKDYKAAVIEYIWNSLEAKATKVDVSIEYNMIDGVERIKIIDNGCGINYDELNKTFGTFLYSQKNEYADCARGKSNKGKGRYSFLAIAANAKWITNYEKDGKVYQYEIILQSEKKDYFDVSAPRISNTPTGTTVLIESGISLVKSDFEEDFKKVLLKEFAWFLFLNKSREFFIAVNGEKLDCGEFIDENLSEEININIDGYDFNIFFIKWIDGISQKFFYYFMDQYFHEKHQEHTKFNNNAVGFFHSVYIISEYFEGFVVLDGSQGQEAMFLKSPKHEVFKELLKELNTLMTKKQKEYLKNEVPKVIDGFEKEGVFPTFKNDKYDKVRKDDLISVVKEVYSIQPKIFYKAAVEQKKTVIGFLNLLLDTDERENIITIIESITELTKEERKSLAGVLRKTSMGRIVSTIKMIENRYAIVELLKKLVFDNGKYSSERLHVQSTIEQNYWLFGEQYNLITADENFEKVLREYRSKICGDKIVDIEKIDNEQHMRRPDIFMCRSRIIEDVNETQLEENIIVELKSPGIILNKDVYRQIEDYMELISNETQFNSQLRKWKFIAVCNKVASEITKKYEAFADKGKKFLVYKQGNYEIYAMTWDDVFKSFDLRHRYLLDKLNYNRSLLLDELDQISDEKGRNKSNDIYQEITNINLSEKII